MSFVFALAFLALNSACVSTKHANKLLQSEFSKYEIASDFDVLETVLAANHPGLYVFTTKEQLYKLRDSIIEQLPQNITIHQARNAFAQYAAAIGCGHTSVRYSKQLMRAGAKANVRKQFPLGIKVWGDSAVLMYNLWGRADTLLTQGAIITEINNLPVQLLLQKMRSVVSTDGNAVTFKDQFISNSFGSLYKTFYPSDTALQVTFISANGLVHQSNVKYYSPPKIATPTIQMASSASKPNPWIKQNVSLQFQPATQTAILSVNNFEGNKGFRRFIRKAFQEIQIRNTKNLIIDLRRNTGGRISLATFLTKYIIDTSFHVADSVYTTSRKIKHSKYVKPSFAYGLHKQLFTRKVNDSLFTVPYFSNKTYKPTAKNHFNGAVFYLTGGYTFSAATLHLHFVHKQPNVTIIGEETGGNYYALNAVHIPDVELPNTKLRVRLPLYRQVFDAERTFTAHGFLPTYAVPPSSQNIRKGIDGKMQKAFDLIKAKPQ